MRGPGVKSPRFLASDISLAQGIIALRMSRSLNHMQARGYGEFEARPQRHATYVHSPTSTAYLTQDEYGDYYEHEYRPMTEKEALQDFTRQMPSSMPPSEIYDAWLAMKKSNQEAEEAHQREQSQGARPWTTARLSQPKPYAVSSITKTGTLPKGGGGKDLIDSRGRWADRPRGSDFPPGLPLSMPPPSGYYSPQLKQPSQQAMVRRREMREGFSSHPVGEVVSYLDVSPRATSEYHGVGTHQISTSKQAASGGRTQNLMNSASFDPNVSHLSSQSGGYYDYGHPHDHRHSDRHLAHSAPMHAFDSGQPAQRRPTFHEDYERRMQQRVRVKAAQQGHYTATKEAFSNPRLRPQSAAPASRPYQRTLRETPRPYHDSHAYPYHEHLDPQFEPEPYFEEEVDERQPLSSYARDAFYSKSDDPSQIGHPKNTVPLIASSDVTLSASATDAGSQVRRMRVAEQDARKSMSAKDLERARANAIGSHAVPGTPNVKLIGGQWKAVTQELNEGKPLWTDYYGPNGGGKEKVQYYGRKWNQDDKRVM
jgi:hypothetical protein